LLFLIKRWSRDQELHQEIFLSSHLKLLVKRLVEASVSASFWNLCPRSGSARHDQSTATPPSESLATTCAGFCAAACDAQALLDSYNPWLIQPPPPFRTIKPITVGRAAGGCKEGGCAPDRQAPKTQKWFCGGMPKGSGKGRRYSMGRLLA
jgi:hypothetical protein